MLFLKKRDKWSHDLLGMSWPSARELLPGLRCLRWSLGLEWPESTSALPPWHPASSFISTPFLSFSPSLPSSTTYWVPSPSRLWRSHAFLPLSGDHFREGESTPFSTWGSHCCSYAVGKTDAMFRWAYCIFPPVEWMGVYESSRSMGWM